MAQIIREQDLPQAVVDALDPQVLSAMLAGANAEASRVAPALADTPTADQLAEARLVLMGALQRWSEIGAGALQQQTAGPFSMVTDTRQRGGWSLWPSEVDRLQAVAAAGGAAPRRPFEIDLMPADAMTDFTPDWWT